MTKHLTWAGRTALAAAATLLTVATPATAQAQFFFFQSRPLFGHLHHFNRYDPRPPMPLLDDELSPREIVAALQRRGFRDATTPVFREDVALVTATDRDGKRLRLTVDVFSGRILDAAPMPAQRPQLAQRAPDQGAAIRRAVPDQKREIRSAPETPPAVRREPVAPKPPQQARPPRPATPAPQPPTAASPAPAPQPGTRTQPRRIDITPPAELDEVRPPAPTPSGPPINSVPPAALE